MIEGVAVSLLATSVAAAVGGVVGYLWARQRSEARHQGLRQTLRMREDQVRTLTFQLSGLRRVRDKPSATEPTPDPADAKIVAVLDEVRSMVAPLADQARRQAALTALPDFEHRGHLAALLAEIGERAGLSSLVLSDEVGLPVADANSSASDELAASSALLLRFADRLRDSGQPVLVSAIIRDTEGRIVLHRVFDVGRERYVLTAVAERASLAPDALDPALPQIQNLLRQSTPALA